MLTIVVIGLIVIAFAVFIGPAILIARLDELTLKIFTAIITAAWFLIGVYLIVATILTLFTNKPPARLPEW